MQDAHNRPVLGDEMLTLRAPVAGDVAARRTLGWATEAMRMFGRPVPDRAFTDEDAQNWVTWLNDDPFGFAVVHGGVMIGFARLYDVNRADRNCSVGLGLLDDTRLGQGIGTAVLRLILAHGFDTLDMHRIALRVAPYNTRAIAAYEKVGFVREGLLRESFQLDGVWYDDICMGLLARELVR